MAHSTGDSQQGAPAPGYLLIDFYSKIYKSRSFHGLASVFLTEGESIFTSEMRNGQMYERSAYSQ